MAKSLFRRGLSIGLGFSLASLAFAFSASAQDRATSTSPCVVMGAECAHPVAAAWMERSTFALRGDRTRVAEWNKHILEVKRSTGVRNATFVALAAIREARSALDKGDIGGANQVGLLAVELAPALPEAHFELARIALRDGRATQAFASFRSGLRATLSNDATRNHLTIRLSIAFLGGIVLLVLITLMILIGRHGSELIHDLRHAFATRMNVFLAVGIAGAVLTLPLVLGLGPLVAALWAALVLWCYLSAKERVTVFIFIASTLLLPIAVKSLARSVHFQILLRSDVGQVDNDVPPSKPIAARGEHWVPRYAEALRLVHGGEYRLALPLLQALARRPAPFAEVITTLGITQYALGDTSGALLALERAAQAMNPPAEAAFALSQIAFERGDLDVGERWLGQAQSVDPARVEELRRAAPTPVSIKAMAESDRPHVLNRYLPTPALSKAILEAAVEEDTATRAQLVAAAWTPLAGPVPIRMAWFVSLAFLGGCIAVTLLTANKKPARACTACGRAVCVVCDESLVASLRCPACVEVQTHRERLDPAAQTRQEKKILTHRTRLRRAVLALHAIAPGTGHALLGEPAWLIVALLPLVLWAIPLGGYLVPGSSFSFSLFTVCVLLVWGLGRILLQSLPLPGTRTPLQDRTPPWP